MTDHELNTAVAEARGQTQHPGFYYQEFATDDGDGWSGICCPRCLAPEGDTGVCAPPVCSSPAAWGALLEELGATAKANDETRLERGPWGADTTPTGLCGTGSYPLAQIWRASLRRNWVDYYAYAEMPGRALALVFLDMTGAGREGREL